MDPESDPIGGMKIIVAILSTSLLSAVVAFCAFGFLATFEPISNAMAFRVGYTVIGTSSLLGAGFLILNAIR